MTLYQIKYTSCVGCAGDVEKTFQVYILYTGQPFLKVFLLTALLQWFIRTVTTVIIYITFPVLGNAAPIAALKLSRTAGSGRAVGWVLI